MLDKWDKLWWSCHIQIFQCTKFCAIGALFPGGGSVVSSSVLLFGSLSLPIVTVEQIVMEDPVGTVLLVSLLSMELRPLLLMRLLEASLTLWDASFKREIGSN